MPNEWQTVPGLPATPGDLIWSKHALVYVGPTPVHLEYVLVAKCPKCPDSQEHLFLASSDQTDLPCFQHSSAEWPLLPAPFLKQCT